MNYHLPELCTNREDVNKAFRIACSDITANISDYFCGYTGKKEKVFIAGMGYSTPWTRDAAINTWNCGALLFPEVAKNTLLSVLEEGGQGLRIGGEYWDSIIWTIGAWHYYSCTGDAEFLKVAYTAVKNTIEIFEKTEFTEALNLFRGGACYGDGIAAYPDVYARGGESGILSFLKYAPEYKASVGEGLPMHTLSTNCLYYYAYVLLEKMCIEQKLSSGPCWKQKALRMKEAINTHFWMEKKGYYRYLVDDFGGCDFQEGLGESFAILFGIADENRTNRILNNVYISPQGLPCLWPLFDRYTGFGENTFARHCGTVWAFIEAFWAEAAVKGNRAELFENELRVMTKRAFRDGHFAEIYHPINGAIYGGIQESRSIPADSNMMMEDKTQKGKDDIVLWRSQIKQTWSASGYIRMILHHLAGLTIEEQRITFHPNLVCGVTDIELKELCCRGSLLNLVIRKGGENKMLVNGERKNVLELDTERPGTYEILIEGA